MIPRVYIWMPSGSWRPFPDVILSIFNQTAVRDKLVDLWFYPDNIVSWKPVHHARNEILQNFLKSKCEYLWFVDDDNPPAYDVLEKLLKHNKDIISAIVPIRHWNLYLLNVFKDWKHLTSYEWMTSLIEIDNAWTWCILMTRKVVKEMFEKYNWHPYEFRYETFWLDLDNDTPKIYNELDSKTNWKLDDEWKVFTREEYISEDLFFWREAKKLWYQMYADVTAHCKHYQKPLHLFVKYEETIDNNTNPKTGELLWWTDYSITRPGEWEYEILWLWSDNDWEQASEWSVERVSCSI